MIHISQCTVFNGSHTNISVNLVTIITVPSTSIIGMLCLNTCLPCYLQLKIQKERLESKELHMELLRRKVSELEEEKRTRSALAMQRDDANVTARKMQVA